MRLICGFSGFAAISEFSPFLCFQLNWVPLKFLCSQIHLFVMLVLTLASESRCLTPVLFSNLFSACIGLLSFPSFFSLYFPWPLTLHSTPFYPLSPHSVSSVCDNKLGEIKTLFLPLFPGSICLSCLGKLSQ